PSSAQQSQLKSLKNQKAQIEATLPSLHDAVNGNHEVTQTATEAAAKGSVVLDSAAPLAHSRLKPLVLEAGVGFVMGMILGLAFVVIQALVTDRLRRRDNVAQALGAPVRLSIGPVRQSRWLPQLPTRPGRDRKSTADLQRVAAHLARVLPEESNGIVSLAVVAVDDVRLPATCLASLAVTCAAQGKQVIVADLCDGAPVAGLLSATDPGVRTVNVRDTTVTVAVPPRDDVAPIGPLDRVPVRLQRSSFGTEVAAACASANLLLTLVVLDPAIGGEHLATWSGHAVAVVTAGWSSWTKIHGVGEMIRLSGTRLISGVLIGADKTDDSLGMVYAPETV
ncbi:MAG TPA: hypothetical protein VF070_04430, partial [Streptosporangiaceae bacterium]